MENEAELLLIFRKTKSLPRPLTTRPQILKVNSMKPAFTLHLASYFFSVVFVFCFGQAGTSSADDLLTDEPKSINFDADGNYHLAQPESNESFQDSRIEELKARIAQVESQPTSREKEMQLRKLRLMLRAANEINGQIANVRPKMGTDKKRVQPSSNDVFVIAKILVAPKSTTADVTFSLLQGELANANDLFDYLAGTPADGFRDYRIISRHGSQEQAETAITLVRQNYDAYKEQESQMLAYMAARNAALAKVQTCRRCCGCGK